tara:strand:+ start:366 stop:611 length:246 start_codon:yes stop_codon:yes gene_type:complete
MNTTLIISPLFLQQTSQRLGLRVKGQGDKALVEDSAMARNPFSKKVKKLLFFNIQKFWAPTDDFFALDGGIHCCRSLCNPG